MPRLQVVIVFDSDKVDSTLEDPEEVAYAVTVDGFDISLYYGAHPSIESAVWL